MEPYVTRRQKNLEVIASKQIRCCRTLHTILLLRGGRIVIPAHPKQSEEVLQFLVPEEANKGNRCSLVRRACRDYTQGVFRTRGWNRHHNAEFRESDFERIIPDEFFPFLQEAQKRKHDRWSADRNQVKDPFAEREKGRFIGRSDLVHKVCNKRRDEWFGSFCQSVEEEFGDRAAYRFRRNSGVILSASEGSITWKREISDRGLATSSPLLCPEKKDLLLPVRALESWTGDGSITVLFLRFRIRDDFGSVTFRRKAGGGTEWGWMDPNDPTFIKPFQPKR